MPTCRRISGEALKLPPDEEILEKASDVNILCKVFGTLGVKYACRFVDGYHLFAIVIKNGGEMRNLRMNL